MSATNGSSLVRIGISPVGRGTFKYADLISYAVAICIHKCEGERFDGWTEGLRHWQSFTKYLRGQLVSSCCAPCFVLFG